MLLLLVVAHISRGTAPLKQRDVLQTLRNSECLLWRRHFEGHRVDFDVFVEIDPVLLEDCLYLVLYALLLHQPDNVRPDGPLFVVFVFVEELVLIRQLLEDFGALPRRLFLLDLH